MAWKQICNQSDIPLCDMKCFSVEDMEIIVYHLESGWYATSDMCTHQDCSLSEGDIEDNEIVCWCHDGAFDIPTGAATRMPCTIPLETFHVRIRDGKIEVDID